MKYECQSCKKSFNCVDPTVLRSTQDSECPFNHIKSYICAKDTAGATVGIDENDEKWLLDGHHRRAAAITSSSFLKVGKTERVKAQDMWDLAEG